MRLIDANALKDYIRQQNGRPMIGITIGELFDMFVDEQPTVEAKPVVHAHDKYQEKKEAHCEFWCSECDYWLYEFYQGDCEGTFNFCPNCGAEMRSEVQE